MPRRAKKQTEYVELEQRKIRSPTLVHSRVFDSAPQRSALDSKNRAVASETENNTLGFGNRCLGARLSRSLATYTQSPVNLPTALAGSPTSPSALGFRQFVCCPRMMTYLGLCTRLLLLLLLGWQGLHITVADPFPLPMAEERRGGLLYFPHVSSAMASGAPRAHRKHAHKLVFESIGVSSDILNDAFDRYKQILSTPTLHLAYEWEVSVPEALLDDDNEVRRVLVYVQNADQSLDIYTDETYSIRISSPDVTIEAQTVVCVFSSALRLLSRSLALAHDRSPVWRAARVRDAHPEYPCPQNG